MFVSFGDDGAMAARSPLTAAKLQCSRRPDRYVAICSNFLCSASWLCSYLPLTYVRTI